MARRPPTGDEIRVRIRKWVHHYWRAAEAKGLNRREFAESLDLSPPTISNLLNNVEMPSIDTFAALHFQLGADPRELLRENPPAVQATDRPPTVAPER